VATLQNSLDVVNAGGLSREATVRWEEERALLALAAKKAIESSSIASIRHHFGSMSRSVLALESTFRHADDTLRYEAFCPMAFEDQGASWLQFERDIRNPYFGASMLSCGEIRTEYLGVAETTRPATGAAATPETSETRPAPTPVVQQPKTPEVKPASALAHVQGLAAVFDGYLQLQTELANDDLGASQRGFSSLATAAKNAEVHGTEGPSAKATSALSSLVEDLVPVAQSLEALRVRFESLTEHVLELHEATGHPGSKPLYRMHCPMAFDNKGADWLQRGKTLANPYFGASMLRCGSVKSELPAAGEKR
jgi:Cu(I)/Ag(I) efflux system membrane fusion protein